MDKKDFDVLHIGDVIRSRLYPEKTWVVQYHTGKTVVIADIKSMENFHEYDLVWKAEHSATDEARKPFPPKSKFMEEFDFLVKKIAVKYHVIQQAPDLIQGLAELIDKYKEDK